MSALNVLLGFMLQRLESKYEAIVGNFGHSLLYIIISFEVVIIFPLKMRGLDLILLAYPETPPQTLTKVEYHVLVVLIHCTGKWRIFVSVQRKVTFSLSFVSFFYFIL